MLCLISSVWDNSATHIKSNYATEAIFQNDYMIFNFEKLFPDGFLSSLDALLEGCQAICFSSAT